MRIVSLCPSITELVFDLGRGEDLVGVTRFCVRPAEGVRAIARVGGTKDPDLARIVALAPDLVLTNAEENRLEDHDALVAHGLRCRSTFPTTVAEAADVVVELGELLQRPAEAREIARDIRRRERRVRAAAALRPPVRFACLIWRRPWMTVNGATFASDLLCAAGGENVFAARPERYPEITAEDLGAADPDVVLLPDEPLPFARRHVEELARATGLAAGRLRLARGDLLFWHGSRTRLGVDYAEQCLLAADVHR